MTRPRIIARTRNASTGDLVRFVEMAATDPAFPVQWPDEFPRQDAPFLVWSALRSLRYVPDNDDQTIRAPHVLLDTGEGDCKSFSVFAAKALAAAGYRVRLRFVAHEPGEAVEHVYVLADKGGRSYVIDGVWPEFDREPPGVEFFDIHLP